MAQTAEKVRWWGLVTAVMHSQARNGLLLINSFLYLSYEHVIRLCYN